MKNFYLLTFFLLVFGLGFSQTKDSLSIEEQARREKNIQAGNPFKKFGYKPKIATLSKGKYLEFHDLDSIVKIGSFSYHVKNKSITGYTKMDEQNTEAGLSPEIISRWMSPDPLSDEFPSWSPYNFVENNPLRMVDPTGLAPEDWIKDRYGAYLWDNNAVDQSTTRQGWSYVGKNLPQGVNDYKILTEKNGTLYHKNTTNLLAKAGNLIGGNFVEHKEYNPVGENNLSEGISTGASMIAGGYIAKGVGSAIGAVTGRGSQLAVQEGFTVNPSKFDYFFGRVVSGAESNVVRSAQNLKDLTTLGIQNESQLVGVFNQAMKSGTTVSTQTSQFGTTVMKSATIGNQGAVNVGFYYPASRGCNLNSV